MLRRKLAVVNEKLDHVLHFGHVLCLVKVSSAKGTALEKKKAFKKVKTSPTIKNNQPEENVQNLVVEKESRQNVFADVIIRTPVGETQEFKTNSYFSFLHFHSHSLSC